MPQFDFPFPRCYNTLRLLGYDYNSVWQLCAISLVTNLRRLFADMKFSKSVLASLLSAKTLKHMRLRAFTLMPNHLHFLAGGRRPEKSLPSLIGNFKSYTTQLYWKRSRRIVESGNLSLPSACVRKSDLKESRPLIEALMDWRATLRPEAVELKNWPNAKPGHFLK
jgi:REP element-mobilizing transposase RayT